MSNFWEKEQQTHTSTLASSSEGRCRVLCRFDDGDVGADIVHADSTAKRTNQEDPAATEIIDNV